MDSRNNNSNKLTVDTAAARQKMENMKYEIANEIGVDLKKGYNGDLTSKEAGYVGGYMTKKLVEMAEQQLSGR